MLYETVHSLFARTNLWLWFHSHSQLGFYFTKPELFLAWGKISCQVPASLWQSKADELSRCAGLHQTVHVLLAQVERWLWNCCQSDALWLLYSVCNISSCRGCVQSQPGFWHCRTHISTRSCKPHCHTDSMLAATQSTQQHNEVVR